MNEKKAITQNVTAENSLVEIKNLAKESFSGDYETTIIEQWKTCVETANSVTEKRNAANGIFITINTALFAVFSLSIYGKSTLLSLTGIAICVLWLKLLENYRQLNEAKFTVINEIEQMLPLSPFKAEWKQLNQQGEYSGLIKIEKKIPRVFIALYVVAILWPAIDWLFEFIQTLVAQ